MVSRLLCLLPFLVVPACSGVVPPATTGPATQAAPDRITRIDLKAASCPQLLTELAGSDLASASTLTTQPPLAVVALAPEADAVVGEMPLEVVDPQSSAGHECLVLVGRPVAGQSSEHLLRAAVPRHATLVTGTRRRANPEHQRLEEELKALKGEKAEAPEILATGVPGVDMIGLVASGVISGWTRLDRQRRLRSIEDDLALTETHVEEPTTKNYSFDVDEVEVERSASAAIGFWDRNSKRGWRGTLRWREKRQFTVGRDPHAGERPFEGNQQSDKWRETITPEDIERWRATPPALPAALLFSDLASLVEREPGRFLTLDELIDELSSKRPSLRGEPRPLVPDQTLLEPAPRAEPTPQDALVRLGDGSGVGFFVHEDMILGAVGAGDGSSLIPAIFSDGLESHALLQARDEKTGLALLYSPRAGEPLLLGTGGTNARSADDDLLPGTPIMGQGGVVAVVDAGRRTVPMADILKRLDGVPGWPATATQR